MLFNLLRIYLLSFICLALQTCNGQTHETACKEYLSKARKIINTANHQKLDSALFFINRSLECKENKVASVELKATILYSMRKYQEGAKFIDSLNANDFSYLYRKQILGDNFRVMTMDSLSGKLLLEHMDSSLTSYIITQKMANIEEQNALIELFEIKKRYMSPSSVNIEIDSLIKIQPSKRDLLEKLRVAED
jgi:hypothetical protein